MASQTTNGKAFEYACACSIFDTVKSYGLPVGIVSSPASATAERAFYSLRDEDRNRYMIAAETALGMIYGLEPRLLNDDDLLHIEIAPDSLAQGVNGDVRDVICSKPDSRDGWNVGFSCKHNHNALKHPRVTASMDFGAEWIGVPCSHDFIVEMEPIIDPLISYGKNKVTWETIENKTDRYYVPILSAYAREISRMCDARRDIPMRLLNYFFGLNDFYKIIMNESASTTTVMAFNMSGSLNKPAGRTRPIARVPVTGMPEQLYDVRFANSSKTTIILTFDAGWAISMRLHNKDKIAKPTSLAWDVNLVGVPRGTYENTRPWYE